MGLDLRGPRAVEAFAAWLEAHTPHLDILVNNACQTIRRPASYYAHLLPGEAAGDRRHRLALAAGDSAQRPAGAPRITDGHAAEAPATAAAPPPRVPPASGTAAAPKPATAAAGPTADAFEETAGMPSGPSGTSGWCSGGVGAFSEAAASLACADATAARASAQVVTAEDAWLASDPVARAAVLPEGHTDAHGQQLDLRTHNSWLLKLGEVCGPLGKGCSL